MGDGRSIVAVVKRDELQSMVGEAFSLLGGVGSFFEPGGIVVVKPNAGHSYPPESSVNTNPALVEAVIRELRKGRPGEIIVAESSAIGCDTWECLEVSGIKEAAERAGADRIIDIKRERDLVDVEIPDARSDIKWVKLPKFLLEADLLVNLPIFKSHVSMVFSCALKNIKGVVQDLVHAQMHFTDLAAAMIDLWAAVIKSVKANLTIADLIRPMEGYGPHCGTPVHLGCVVAGIDPVSVDAVACRLVGLDAEKVEYLREAQNRGLGNMDMERIEIRGEVLDNVSMPLHLPYLEGFDAWPEYRFFTENACSTCQGLIAYTMVRMQALGEYEKNAGAQIVIGRKKDIPEGVDFGKDLILIGDCLRPLRKKIEDAGKECVFVSGCPPLETFPYWALRDRVDQPRLELITSPELREKERLKTEEENRRFLEWLRAGRE